MDRYCIFPPRLSYVGRLGFVGQRGGIKVRILELSARSSQFSGPVISFPEEHLN